MKDSPSSETEASKKPRRRAIPGTDLANAERFVADHSETLRHARGKGWLEWDGKVWKDNGDEAAARAAQRTARNIQEAAYLIEDPDIQEDAMKWAKASQNSNRLSALIATAKSFPPIASRYEDFDQGEWGFNCQSGIIDLRTGKLWPHSPEHLCTRISPAHYNPAPSDNHLWLDFINDVTGGDKELAGYLKRMSGYFLTGSNREKCFFFCYGSKGNNGKSVFIEALNALLGDYSIALGTETITKNRFKNSASNDLARLAGPRLATVSETSVGEEWDDGKIKNITGGDVITARYLHKEYFDFRPRCKLLIRGNNKPEVTDNTSAMWKRIHLIPFEVHFPEELQDKELLNKLIRRELSDILQWAVEGCIEWHRTGLQPPACVLAAVKEYQSEQDMVGTFLTECCETVTETITIRASDAHAAYKKWCETHGYKPISMTAFGIEIRAKNFQKGENNRGVVYKGLRLLETPHNGGSNSESGQSVDSSKQTIHRDNPPEDDDDLPF